MFTVFAHAKINLTLEVIGRREDGYHEIASVLQTIDLADELTFQPADTIGFVCRDTGLSRAELLEETILGAADLLQSATGCDKGVRIQFERARVPRAAGLGSSSSVPAAVLKGLNELWSLGLSLEELSWLASKLGSDTPFFIYGGTAMARGRGEHITPLPSLPETWIVLLRPAIDPIPEKTAKMYSGLSSSDFTSGAETQRLTEMLQQGNSLPFEVLCNTFESAAFDFVPSLKEYRQKLLAAGAERVHLAGSGPMLFTLVSGKTQGETLVNRLEREALEVYLTRTVL